MHHNRQKVSESPSCATTQQIRLTTQSRRPYANERASRARLRGNHHTNTDVNECAVEKYILCYYGGKKLFMLFVQYCAHFEENICEL